MTRCDEEREAEERQGDEEPDRGAWTAPGLGLTGMGRGRSGLAPVENRPPLAQTGRISVVPACNSFRSMLPPKQRGSTELTAPQFGGGATAMMPKNGASFSVPPQGGEQVMALRSIGMCSSR